MQSLSDTPQELLLVDDDVALCELLREYLETEGFVVSMVHDAAAAVEAVSSRRFQLMILDVMLPGGSGFDVLRDLRQGSDLPVLMLTARGEDVDRIVGLEIGADDYLSKPCNPRELVARIRAVLRRVHAAPDREKATIITVDELEIRVGERVVRISDDELDLTATEFNVLLALVTHAGEVVTKDKLYQEALGRKIQAYDRSIDMHVSRLRKKLGNLPDGGERIKTVRGTGYQFVKRA